MRVLHVIGQLVPGGSEKMTLQVAERFGDRGLVHRVAVLGEIDPGYAASVGAAGVAVHRVPVRGRGPLAGARSLAAVIRLAREHRVEMIQGHAWRSSVVAGVAGAVLGIPAAATLHRIYYPRAERILDPLLQRLWTAVIVDSHAVAALLSARAGIAPERIRVVPNFVSGAMLEQAPALGESSAGGPLRVLMAAHFTSVKGHRFALEAVAELERERPGRMRLDLIGDGPLLAETRDLASRLGVGHAVHFHGRRSDLTAWLERCDVVLLPSLWEGFGLILAEAMAFGRPPVAFDVGGAAEVIADGETGLLTPPGDARALAAALRRLDADPELRDRLGRGGRQRVRELYAPDVVIDSWAAVYRSCVEGARAA